MKLKRIAALILATVMLLECVPLAFAEELGAAMEKPKAARYQSSWTQHGTTLDDQTLDGDLILTNIPSMYIDGTLTFTGGGRMVVRSGQHRISRDAVIKGDIVIEGEAELEIDGIVEGDIVFEQPERILNSEDAWCSLRIGEHGVVRAIRGERFVGRVEISGSVSRIDIQGEYGGENSEPERYGEFWLCDNAYVGSAAIRGDYAASLEARDNALISSLTLDGWGWSGIFGAHVQKAFLDGGKYLSVEDGATIDYLEITGHATQSGTIGSHIGEAHIDYVGENDKRYHGGLWMFKGSTLGTAYVGQDGRLCINNNEFDECDAFEGTPYEQIDWRPLYRESVADTVYLSGNAELQNKGYIKKLYSTGNVFVLHMGKLDYGYIENAQDYHFMLEDPNRPDSTYHDGLVGVINSNVYADGMCKFLHAKNSNLNIGVGVVLGTVIADSCHVNLLGFNEIDTLILNRSRGIGVFDETKYGSYFSCDGRINNLLLGYSYGDRFHEEDPLGMTVRNAAVYGTNGPIAYDIDRLFVPKGHKTAESALTNWRVRIEEGERPTQEMLDAQLAADPQSMEGVELITVPKLGEAYYVGEVIEASARKKDGQITRGGATQKKAEKLKLRSNNIRKNEAQDWWYQIEVQPLQTLNLSFDAGEGMGALTVFSPGGEAHTLVSAGEPAAADILCRDGGTYYLRLSGAANDYQVVTKATNPIRVDWTVNRQQADQKGEGERTKLDLTELEISVENKTRGTRPEFIVTSDAILLTNDQADRRDTLVLTAKDPQDSFIPVTAEVRLKEGEAVKKTTAYEYGSYRATCTDFTDVTMHLYDGEGNYLRTFDEHRGVYTVDKLLPGEYQAVMIRGDVGRWRFAKLSDYADFGLEEKRDYRLDAFTLKEGYLDYYPSATVPQEPMLDSPYAVESESRYEAARSACLVGGSVLMRVEYALENMDAISEAYVDVQIGEGMSVQPEYVTLDGEITPAQIVDGFLRVPVTGREAGQIAFYAFGGEVEELLSIARLTLETGEGTQRAYLGFSNVEMKTLSIDGSRRSSGTINLYGYGVPGERVTILHNGTQGMSATCDGEGKWNAVMNVEATQLYTDHEFAAVMYPSTEEELVSPQTLTVRVHDSFPALESISLYYYEHGRQKKKEVTAQEFYRGRMHYNYEPGTEFTCKVRFSNADRLEKLYYVREYADGKTEYLPGVYDQATDTWSIVGKFPYAATNGKWKFEYVLTPLPEPQPFTQEEIDAIQALELPQMSVEVTEFDLDEDGYPVGKIRYMIEGQEPMEFDLDMGIDFDEWIDLEYIEAEAAEMFEDEAGNRIYILKDTDNPETTHFYIIEGEKETAFSIYYHMAERSMEILLCAMSAEALAEDGFFDQAMDTIGDHIAGFGKGLMEAISGLLLTTIDVWAYNVQIGRLWYLKNKLIELEAKLADELEKAKTRERWECLDNKMTELSNLKNGIQGVADLYGRKATIQGIRDLLLDRLGGKVGEMLAGKVGLLKGLKNKFNSFNDMFEKAGRAIGRAKNKIDDLTKKLNDMANDFAQKNKDMLDKLNAFKEKWQLDPEHNMYLKNLVDEFEDISDFNDMINNIGDLDANAPDYAQQVSDLLGDYLGGIDEGIMEDFLDTGTDPETYAVLMEEIKGLQESVQNMADWNRQREEIEKELEQEKENLKQAEEEQKEAEEGKAKAREEAEKLVKEMEEEKKGIIEKMVDETAKEMYDKFMKDFNDIHQKYRWFVAEADNCPPDVTPTPEPETTPTPDNTPDPDATPTPTPPPGNDDPGDTDPGIEGEDPGKKDPSGYVYEGVWTNRIEGVTTTAYTMNEKGEAVMWDASLHGQENPLTTDSQGYYEWYVPDGMWQVKYEKDGYETAYSEWLPVPPPQTEVHQGIVSYALPEVKHAIHYGDYVEIAFTRPVKVDTVNDSTVQIGAAFTGEPRNPERVGESDTVLASVFRLHPASALGREIAVNVTGGVLSYADVPAAEKQMACQRRSPLEGLSAPGSVELKAGEPAVLMVRAIGEGDYQKYSLTISGAHEDLLQVGEAFFEADGQAAIPLTPVSAGALTLTIAVPDTEIEAAVRITIVN